MIRQAAGGGLDVRPVHRRHPTTAGRHLVGSTQHCFNDNIHYLMEYIDGIAALNSSLLASASAVGRCGMRPLIRMQQA